MLMLASTVFFTVNILLVRALGDFATHHVWLISSTRFAVGLVLITLIYRRECEPSHLFRNPRLASRRLVGGLGIYGYYVTGVHIGAVWLLRERFSLAPSRSAPRASSSPSALSCDLVTDFARFGGASLLTTRVSGS